MFVVETSLVLPHPAAAVFLVAGDLHQAPRWRAGIMAVSEDPPTAAPRVHFGALRGRWWLTTRMVACHPPRFVAWEGRGDELALELSLWLEPVPDGTRVTYHCALSLEEDALPARHATALRRLLVRRAPRDLERLAALVAERAPLSLGVT